MDEYARRRHVSTMVIINDVTTDEVAWRFLCKKRGLFYTPCRSELYSTVHRGAARVAACSARTTSRVSLAQHLTLDL